MRSHSLNATLLAVLALAACADDPPASLAIDVKTDLVPRVQFAIVDIEVDAKGAGSGTLMSPHRTRGDPRCR